MALTASSKDVELLVRRLSPPPPPPRSELALGVRFVFFQELERECGAEWEVEHWTGALNVLEQ